MTTIRYWTGTEAIEVEVTDETAAAYRESLREEWRSDKRAERHQAAVSLTQTEDGSGYLLADLSTGDIAEAMIERGEAEERRVKLKAAFATLTPEQIDLVKMLKAGLSGSEIARRLGICKQAVSQMRIRIQEKLKKYLQ